MTGSLKPTKNEFIETHYREVENMYQKMRGWRHDYHNHIQTLKFLAANNDIVGIREYLNELDTNLSILDSSIRTGNSMADAILNSKVSLAKAREIDVRVDAHIPVKLQNIPKLTCAAFSEICSTMQSMQAWLSRRKTGSSVFIWT